MEQKSQGQEAPNGLSWTVEPQNVNNSIGLLLSEKNNYLESTWTYLR